MNVKCSKIYMFFYFGLELKLIGLINLKTGTFIILMFPSNTNYNYTIDKNVNGFISFQAFPFWYTLQES